MTTLLEGVCKRQIERAIKDPELRRKVTPNYRLGRTRMLISNDWYPALARENVELIDHGVEALTEKGLIANGKEYEVDVIVWATGYKSPSQGFPFPLTGVGGRDLNTYWKDGAKAYKGVSIAGFVRPDAGRIRIGGRIIDELPPLRQPVAWRAGTVRSHGATAWSTP